MLKAAWPDSISNCFYAFKRSMVLIACIKHSYGSSFPDNGNKSQAKLVYKTNFPQKSSAVICLYLRFKVDIEVSMIVLRFRHSLLRKVKKKCCEQERININERLFHYISEICFIYKLRILYGLNKFK